MRKPLALIVLLTCAATAPLLALEARIMEVRTIGPSVRASVELRDVFSDKLRKVVEGGQPLHVRIQAELWEDRPMWDKLVRPAIVSVFRIIRDPNQQITVDDAVGVVTTLSDLASAVPLRVEVAPSEALSDGGKYYVRIVATVGAVEPSDAAETGDVVFGRDDGTISMARMGKLIFKTVVQVADYLQNESTEAKSRVFGGREARGGFKGD